MAKSSQTWNAKHGCIVQLGCTASLLGSLLYGLCQQVTSHCNAILRSSVPHGRVVASSWSHSFRRLLILSKQHRKDECTADCFNSRTVLHQTEQNYRWSADSDLPDRPGLAIKQTVHCPRPWTFHPMRVEHPYSWHPRAVFLEGAQAVVASTNLHDHRKWLVLLWGGGYLLDAFLMAAAGVQRGQHTRPGKVH